MCRTSFTAAPIAFASMWSVGPSTSDLADARVGTIISCRQRILITKSRVRSFQSDIGEETQLASWVFTYNVPGTETFAIAFDMVYVVDTLVGLEIFLLLWKLRRARDTQTFAKFWQPASQAKHGLSQSTFTSAQTTQFWLGLTSVCKASSFEAHYEFQCVDCVTRCHVRCYGNEF
jgi:hypothetical protein